MNNENKPNIVLFILDMRESGVVFVLTERYSVCGGERHVKRKIAVSGRLL